MCQKSLRDERQRVQMVIEAMPRKLAAAKQAEAAKDSASVAGQEKVQVKECH